MSNLQAIADRVEIEALRGGAAERRGMPTSRRHLRARPAGTGRG